MLNRSRRVSGGVTDLAGEVWVVTAPKNKRAFFKYLHQLLPEKSTLFIEGVSARDVASFLKSKAPNIVPHVRKEIVFPLMPVFHLPVTPGNMQLLATLMKRYPVPEAFTHAQAYKDNEMLMEWHDVYCDDPILISRFLAEMQAKPFFERPGCSCRTQFVPER